MHGLAATFGHSCEKQVSETDAKSTSGLLPTRNGYYCLYILKCIKTLLPPRYILYNWFTVAQKCHYVRERIRPTNVKKRRLYVY